MASIRHHYPRIVFEITDLLRMRRGAFSSVWYACARKRLPRGQRSEGRVSENSGLSAPEPLRAGLHLRPWTDWYRYACDEGHHNRALAGTSFRRAHVGMPEGKPRSVPSRRTAVESLRIASGQGRPFQGSRTHGITDRQPPIREIILTSAANVSPSQSAADRVILVVMTGRETRY